MMTVLIIVNMLLLLIIIAVLFKYILSDKEKNSGIDEVSEKIIRSQTVLRQEMNSNVQSSVKNLGDMIASNQHTAWESQAARLDDMRLKINDQLKTLEGRLLALETTNEQKLDAMRATMSKQLSAIQEDNHKKLDAIQTAVNEKLENKMNESFRLVSERLEQVYKGLGEMQTIASGVGDLKKVLSNVKNRGILGEIQLGAILREILAPEQYDEDIAVIPKSANRVEYAVKLPGENENGFVYLPIDSKFPGDTFAALQDAYEEGDAEKTASAKKNLYEVVRKCAKDIHDKYISVPYTTNFGIMFLPFEGLYAEIVNSGLVEKLQREFNVNVAGPSTMAALLNSLQMGFKTLAIQKRSNEVWEILSGVKNEFSNFEKVLDETQKHIRKVDEDLNKLVGVRTRQINRKLSMVESISADENVNLIG